MQNTKCSYKGKLAKYDRKQNNKYGDYDHLKGSFREGVNPLITDGISVRVDDRSKVEILSENFNSMRRVSKGFHKEQTLPFPPPGIDELQITKNWVYLHISGI